MMYKTNSLMDLINKTRNWIFKMTGIIENILPVLCIKKIQKTKQINVIGTEK